MSLLAHAIAYHAVATPDVLRAAAQHVAYNDHGAIAALLAHPSLPGDVTLPRFCDNVALDIALHLPHATDTTRKRVMDGAGAWTRISYLDMTPTAHPAALKHLAQHLPADTARMRDRMRHVLEHPALVARDELTALVAHLSMPVIGGDTLRPGHREYALTRATAHPEHLAELAAIAAPELGITDDLTRYADLWAAGQDPYAARISDVLRATQAADHRSLAWADAVWFTGDADVAARALRAAPSTADVIVATSRLRYTDVGFRARFLVAGRPAPSPRPRWVPTDVDLALVGDPDPVRLLSALTTTRIAPGALHVAVDAALAAAAPGYGPSGRTLHWHAERLCLHPDLTTAQRHALAAAARRPDTPQPGRRASTVLHQLAASRDPITAALATPVDDLASLSELPDLMPGTHLAQRLVPAVAHLCADATAARTALSLEAGFTGTLADLLSATATITS